MQSRIIHCFYCISGKRNSLSIIRFIILVSLAFTSCKNDNLFLGPGFIPQERITVTQLIDTLTIDASLITQEPSPEIDIPVVTIGSIKDPVFGTSQASLVAQFAQRTFQGFRDSTIPLLVRVAMPVPTFMGDAGIKDKIQIYKLNQYLNGTYTTAFDPKGIHDSTNLVTGVKRVSRVNNNITAEYLEISLAPSLMNFLYSIDTTTYKGVSSFLQKFNGLYFTTNQVTSGGGFMSFDLRNLNIEFLYLKQISGKWDTLTMILNYNYSFKDPANSYNSVVLKKINIFSNDYSGSSLEPYLNKKTDSLNFVHSLDGAIARISIPNIMELTNTDKLKMPASIHYAELLLQVDTLLQKTSGYSPPPNLTPYFLSSAGNFKYSGTPYTPYDLSFDRENYDSKNKLYKIKVTRNIQDLIEKKIIDLNLGNFVLIPSTVLDATAPYYYPWGVVFKKPILKIYYSSYSK